MESKFFFIFTLVILGLSTVSCTMEDEEYDFDDPLGKVPLYITSYDLEEPRSRRFFPSENMWPFRIPHRYYKRSGMSDIIDSWDSNAVPLPNEYMEARQTRARGNYKNTLSFGRQPGGHHAVETDGAKTTFRRFSKRAVRGYFGMRG